MFALSENQLRPEARFIVLAQGDEIDYNLAYIPVDFHPKRTSKIDTNYMNQEFELAYNLARSAYKWSKYPPGFEPANPPPAPGQAGRGPDQSGAFYFTPPHSPGDQKN